MRNGLPKFISILYIAVFAAAIGVTLLFIQYSQAKIPKKQSVFTENSSPTFTSTSTSTSTTTQTPVPDTPTPAPPTSTPIPSSPTPSTPQPQIIGYSLGARPIEVYQFGQGPIEKMIVAGIHGGYEWNTVVLADEMIAYLKTHPEIIPEDNTLFFLRVFNPDGLERSTGFGGRSNDNNADLNRNFPSNWQAEWPRPGCWDYIPINGGTGPASEPETRALIEFVQNHDLVAFISYHSAALGIFPGGQPPDDGSLSLAEALASVSNYPYPPIDAGCVYTGQLVDWISDQGIPGVDVELTNHQNSDFEINLAILSVFLDWSFPGIE